MISGLSIHHVQKIRPLPIEHWQPPKASCDYFHRRIVVDHHSDYSERTVTDQEIDLYAADYAALWLPGDPKECPCERCVELRAPVEAAASADVVSADAELLPI